MTELRTAEFPGLEMPDPRERLRRRTVDRDTLRYDAAVQARIEETEVLRFVIFTEEDVEYSPIEESRVRLMYLWWYLSDGTMRILEPKEDNSGLVQGEFLARRSPTRDDGSPLELEDLLPLGASFDCCGRVFTVADADEWTRRWLESEAGIALGEPVAIPPTYHHPPTEHVHDHARATKVALDAGFEENPELGFYSRAPDTRARFLENHRRVLRFEAVEDARDRPFGDVRVYALHFYLEDDTVEVVIPQQENSGRDPFSRLLKRQRVPFTEEPTRQRVGFLTPQEAEAAADEDARRRASSARFRFSPASAGGTYVSPITGEPMYCPSGRPSTPSSGPRHLTADHLVVGNSVLLFGHRLFLRRADGFTIEWYRDNLGMDQTSANDATPLLDLALSQHAGEEKLPPYEGIVAIGDDEETRENARRLLPTFRAEPDLEKAHQERGKVLRFLARLDAPSGPEDTQTLPLRPEDAERRFVINFFLEDDTVSILEKLTPNSGRLSSKFLDRGRFRLRGDMTSPGTAPASHNRGIRFGYEHGYGQGYFGGPLGREDHVAAGPTGVVPVDNVGLIEPGLPPAARAPPRFCEPADFRVGGTVAFHHSPSQRFRIVDADQYTKEFYWERGWDIGQPPPSGEEEGTLLRPHRFQPVHRVAQAMSGCYASVETRLRRLDLHGRGALPARTVAAAMADYLDPAVVLEAGDIHHVLEQHHQGDGELVAYRRLLAALRDAHFDTIAHQRTMDRILLQLKSACQSSLAHLRQVVRDLVTPGAISPAEFHRLLRRHHLDVGLTPKDVQQILHVFPPSDSDDAPEGSIDCRGFLRHLLANNPDDEDEVNRLMRLVHGMSDHLPRGAGRAPEVFPHVPRGSAWGPDPFALPAEGPQAWLATKAKTEGIERALGRSLPDLHEALLPSASAAPPAPPSPRTDDQLSPERKRDFEEEEGGEEPEGTPEHGSRSRSALSTAASPFEARDADIWQRLREFFHGAGHRLERIFLLYDTTAKGFVTRQAAISALKSAGFSMRIMEADDAFSPRETYIDYRALIRDLTE